MARLRRRSDENRILATERKAIAESTERAWRAAAQQRVQQIADEEEAMRAAAQEKRARRSAKLAAAEARRGAESDAWVASVVQGESRRIPRLYGWLSILVWSVAAAILVALRSATALGLVIVIPFILIAPGAAFVLLLRLRRLALIATVVSLTAVAVGVLVPSILLYSGIWSPRAAFAAVAGATFATAAVGFFREADGLRRPLKTPR
jgi:hypothetical protein